VNLAPVLPIAGLESACPQDRHGAERCQHRIQHLARLMGRAARSRSSGTTIGCGLNDDYYLIGSGLEAAGNCAELGVNVSHCADEVSCRLFLCGRCRSQVLVCRDCDRGQIYCFGTCAQDARRENQREARRRYQATPRGRAMHAARSRRYRARGQCVTDHSPPNEQKADPFLELEVGEALSERSRSRRSPLQWLCHHCRRSASEFVRLSPLRPRRNRRKTGQIGRGGPSP
jgi:hypothetical protein